MLNETMRNIEMSITDMLTGLQKIDDSTIYAYHHKVEYKYNLILKTTKDIEDYRKSE